MRRGVLEREGLVEGAGQVGWEEGLVVDLFIHLVVSCSLWNRGMLHLGTVNA